ncbi:MAG: hypothetical protein QF535_06695 [Anaerolineales bacterium]|jgi:hypothetical protein|nr:hypothetical protein [Anaerolineales bacterium]
MNEKGQIMAMDFLISVIAVTLAVGLLIQFAEIKTYNENDDIAWLELKEIAESAADRLVGSPNIVCELIDAGGNPLYSLMNCLPRINSPRMDKEDLGIPPTGFDCLLEETEIGTGVHPNSSNCEGDPTDVENVYSISRKVVIFNQGNNYQISKSQLNECLTGNPSCKLNEQTIRLKVWKA